MSYFVDGLLLILLLISKRNSRQKTHTIVRYSPTAKIGEENLHGSKISAWASIKDGRFIFLLNAKLFYRYDLNLVYNSYAKYILLEEKKGIF